MEKSDKNEKDISFVLDTRTITSQKKSYSLKATKSQLQELADYYNLPAVKNLSFDFEAFLNKDVFELKGKLKSTVEQTCVVSLENFEEKINHPCVLLFSDDADFVAQQEKKEDFLPEEDFVDLVENGRIYFHDIVREQFGLALNPFPRKTDEPFVYYEEKTEDVKENPFSVLKHLTK